MFKKLVTQNVFGDPATFVGRRGDITVDSTHRITVHDGLTPGGALESSPSATIVRQYTGNPNPLDSLDLQAPITVSNVGGDTVYSSNGLFLTGDTSFQAEGSLQTLEYQVGGFTEDFSMGYAIELTDLKFDELAVVGGDFGPWLMPNLTDLSIPALTAVNGGFYAYGMYSLDTLSAPSLTTVGDDVEIGWGNIKTISLPSLKETGSGFYIYDQPELTSVSVPSLTTVGDELGMGELPNLTSLSFPSLVLTNNEIGIYNCGLRDLSFPSLTECGYWFHPHDMDELRTLSAPVLEYVGGYFEPENLPSLRSLSFPSLGFVAYGFEPRNMDALNSISCPVLTYVGGDFEPENMQNLRTVDVSSLETVDGFYPYNLASMETLRFASLASVGGNFGPYNLPSLRTLSLPALQTVGGQFSTYGTMPALETVTINPALQTIGSNFTITDAALSQESVDHILVTLAAMDGSGDTTTYDNHTINLSGGTSAAPSETGTAAITVLEGRGNTVITN